MRTTLTIDDDAAVLLERVRKSHKTGLKSIVNEALRQGLKEMTKPHKVKRPYRTRSVSLGRCLVGNIDNVAEVLAVSEGEGFK
jgi:hypothetical protein